MTTRIDEDHAWLIKDFLKEQLENLQNRDCYGRDLEEQEEMGDEEFLMEGAIEIVELFIKNFK